MIETSIVIVSFRDQELVKRLVQSLPKDRRVEIIIEDNSKQNLGFAKAANNGAKKAGGKYLLFLNPDSVVQKGTIKKLVQELKANPKIGIIGPQLIDQYGKAYLSFTRQPTFVDSLIVYSLISKLWPNNQRSKRYWMKGVDLAKIRQVESLSGAAIAVRRDEFLKLGGFDERFFLYWEDYDLSYRYREAGYRLQYNPQAKVVHDRGGSTTTNKHQATNWFKQARWQFFCKRYGWLPALVAHTFLLLQEEWRLLLIMVIALCLRTWRFPELMPFIGDQARDFVVAEQAISRGELPLLGIESSVPRFSQGPLYLWLLMGLQLMGFRDPIWAGWVAVVTSLITLYLTYRLINHWFGERAALLSGLILATSPLVVAQSRLPFMTNPIPLVTLWYAYRLSLPYTKQNLFWLGLTFALVFQFELATFPLGLLLVWYIYYYRKAVKRWVASTSIIIAGILIGLIPQLVYDLTHQFKQVGLFVVWVGYRLAAYVGFDAEHTVSAGKLTTYLHHLDQYLSRFVAWGIPHSSLLLLLLGFGFWQWRRGKLSDQAKQTVAMLYLWIGVLLLGFMVHSAPSEAYFPALFLPLTALAGWVLSRFKKSGLVTVGVIILVLFNSYYLVAYEMLMSTINNMASGKQFPYGIPYATQQKAARLIAEQFPHSAVNLYYMGAENKVPHFMDGYAYLTELNGGMVDINGVPVGVTYTEQYIDKSSQNRIITVDNVLVVLTP